MFNAFLRPHFRLVPDGTRIQFMKGRFMGLLTSAVLSTASLILFFHPGLHLGIDFSGAMVNKVQAALNKAEPGSKVLRTDAIGASVSAQLLHNGILALVVSLAMILVYIWFRFEWEFAIGA